MSPCNFASPALCEGPITALAYLVRLCLMRNDWPRLRSFLADLRRALETYRAFGSETFYEWNTLSAGFLEVKMLERQHLYGEAAECLRRELPLAERLQARKPLPPEAQSELARLYQSLAGQLHRAGQGSPDERIAILRKGLEFAQAGVDQDNGDSAANFELAWISTRRIPPKI